MTFRRAALPSILFWPLALSGAGSRATVKTEAAPVYSHQRSSPNEIVTTLKRGDAVSVQLTVSSSEGNWCEVTGFAGSGTSGFMRCADLQREPAVRQPPATYIAPAPPPTAAGKPPAVAHRPRPAPLSVVETAVREYLYPVQRWADAFDFTTDQQTALTELAGRVE